MTNGPLPTDNGRHGEGGDSPREKDHGLVRLLKPVVVRPEYGGSIDTNYISPRFYNCFNYSLLSAEDKGVSMTVGVTSPNAGEGKTLVAANLGVSLARANQRDTLLIDLHMQNPRLHAIFGTILGPGLLDALDGGPIQISRTQIDHLYLLPAGDARKKSLAAQRLAISQLEMESRETGTGIGVEQLATVRNILYSVKREFEFIIVDMPELREPRIPVLLTHEMDGLLVVVDAGRTRHEDLERIFRRLNMKQVIGFVLNRSSDSGD